jgi:hypothetical protein
MRVNLPLSLLAAAVLGLVPCALRAQSAADSAAIRATALDYAEGWYAADAARMQRALHPDLAKRIMMRRDGNVLLEHMTAATLVDYTSRGGGRNTPAGQQEKDVRILDIFGNAASVRATMAGWIDYLHIAKNGEGRWVIVNVLWEMKPRG